MSRLVTSLAILVVALSVIGLTDAAHSVNTPSCQACNRLRALEHNQMFCKQACRKEVDIPVSECAETCDKLYAISKHFSDRVTDPCNTIGHCLTVDAVALDKSVNKSHIPLVMMHGFNSNAASMQLFDDWTKVKYPGIYIKNMEIGDGQLSSVFMSMDKQVQTFCDNIKADENLKNGFDLLGFSQGTVLTRGFIERCNTYGVRHWISLAGVNGGIFGSGFLPTWVDPVVAKTPYVDWIQNTFSFAQYWKDPFDLSEYLAKSRYLADLNNERPVKNPNYRKNIESLEKAVLIYSSKDDIVRPRPSGIFSFFANSSDSEIVPYEATKAFAEDFVGLHTLHQDGRLYLYVTTCLHSEHHTETCYNYYEQYILPFLGNPVNYEPRGADAATRVFPNTARIVRK